MFETTVVSLPPLTVSTAELEHGLAILDRALGLTTETLPELRGAVA